jgi:SAM-dependent methyltransferase
MSGINPRYYLIMPPLLTHVIANAIFLPFPHGQKRPRLSNTNTGAIRSSYSVHLVCKVARELDLTNVRYAVADILCLGSLGRSFDLIEASGVLHHMADPLAAWRVLLSILRPGGLMNVGLYSELARKPLLRARDLIAERGYQATADGIRRCRQDLASQSGDPLFKTLTESVDFFTVSGCRDLLFHAHESRLSLRQIAAFIDEEKLTFLGFDADPMVLKEYAARFPNDPAQTNLACWHEFEIENPDSFIGMYQFWIQKP